MEPRPASPPSPTDDVQWLAMLIRRALLLIVAGIEQRYGIMGQREKG